MGLFNLLGGCCNSASARFAAKNEEHWQSYRELRVLFGVSSTAVVHVWLIVAVLRLLNCAWRMQGVPFSLHTKLDLPVLHWKALPTMDWWVDVGGIHSCSKFTDSKWPTYWLLLVQCGSLALSRLVCTQIFSTTTLSGGCSLCCRDNVHARSPSLNNLPCLMCSWRNNKRLSLPAWINTVQVLWSLACHDMRHCVYGW